MTDADAIAVLEQYRTLVDRYKKRPDDSERRQLIKDRAEVEHIIGMVGCAKTVTMSPPPLIGGLLIKHANPFDYMFNQMYGKYAIQTVCDMIDESIGKIGLGALNRQPKNELLPQTETEKNYAFIAMAIDDKNKELQDVLDAIKAAASALGINAERVDEQQKNERITDRILESIRRAEFVICDLSLAKPNVYYEAGYAQALGKVPVYVARKNTPIQFDLKDYPIIFFENIRELREGLSTRLKAIAVKR